MLEQSPAASLDLGEGINFGELPERVNDLLQQGVRPQLGQDWLAQRHYPDLDPRAERALRAAGLSWQDEAEAERRLAEACSLAPEHMAVLIAHYRYHLYKHRFEQAERYAAECLRRVARELGLPLDYRQVRAEHADFTSSEPRLRFWLFGLQAHGYVLLRCGRREEGIAALEQLARLDSTDQTKTRSLLTVIEAAGCDE